MPVDLKQQKGEVTHTVQVEHVCEVLSHVQQLRVRGHGANPYRHQPDVGCARKLDGHLGLEGILGAPVRDEDTGLVRRWGRGGVRRKEGDEGEVYGCVYLLESRGR